MPGGPPGDRFRRPVRRGTGLPARQRWSGTMVMISDAARSRIQTVGKTLREIQQSGIPFNIPIGVPVANPFVRKPLLFRARYKVTGVTFEDVREGVMFASFRDFMDLKMETFSRKAR